MLIVAAIISVGLIAIDQVIKYLVITNMELGQTISVIHFGDTEIFNLTFVYNEGAAWSIFSGKTSFLLIFTGIFMAGIIFYLIKYASKKPFLAISLSLVISGGIGNMIDRIFRDGKVIDYIEARFIDFPIFNFADICVVFGVIFFVLYTLIFDKDEMKQKEVPNE